MKKKRASKHDNSFLVKLIVALAVAVAVVIIIAISRNADKDPDKDPGADGANTPNANATETADSSYNENYTNSDYLNTVNADIGKLFYSEAIRPSDEKAKQVRERLNNGISTFASAKIRTILEDTAGYTRTFIKAGAADEQFWEGLQSGSLIFLSSTQEPVTIDSMVSGLQGVKECVNVPETRTDIERAQLLLLASAENRDAEGLFFAHHILSDLAYWGFLYDMEMSDYGAWEGYEEVQEREVFYGITNTWEFNYPSRVSGIVNNVSVDVAGLTDYYRLYELVDTRNREIEQLVLGLDPDKLSLLIEKLSMINIALAEIVFDDADAQGAYDGLLGDVEACIAAAPEGALYDDLYYIRQKLEEYKLFLVGDSADTWADTAADQRYCFILSKRVANELLKIVFANDKPLEFNDPYYGVTKMLEGEGVQRQ